MYFLISMYLVLFFLIGSLIVKEYKNKKMINSFLFFNISFSIYFILIPIVILFIPKNSPNYDMGFLKYLRNLDIYDYYYGFIFTFLFYIFTVLFYKLLSLKSKNRTTKENNLATLLNILQSNSYIIGLTCFILGLFSELIIIKDLGGVAQAISKGDILRTFSLDGSSLIPQNHLFLTITMVLSLAGTYLLYLSNRIAFSITKFLLLIISFSSSIFYLLFNAGRLGILLFGMCFLLDYAFRKLRHPFIFIFLVSIIGIVLLEQLDNLFFYLSYGYIKQTESTGIIGTINEFSFPYINVLNVLKINECFGLRYGVDFVTWVVNIIPYSILSNFGLNKIIPSYEFITRYYVGQGSTGGVPTDFITQGIRQFGFIGVFLSSFLLAFVCRIIDSFLTKSFFDKFTFFALRITSFGFVILPYGDIDSFIKNRMDIIILILTLYVVNKKNKKYKQNEIAAPNL